MRSTAPSLAILLGLLAFARPAHAQAVVTGTTVDGEGTLPGVNVVATRLAPDSTRTGTVSGLDGAFRLTLSEGTYRLRFSFVGYEPAEREVTVRGEAVDLGRIALALDVVALDEAVVEAVQERVTLRGDTTAYNAAAFQVNPDASAEDLVAKLPGVVVQDGEVQAEGEAVRRVLVDGEEFFGDDPTAALRNLPAEIIQEIQVFDRQSDQARFTGFDDGNEEKTINVVTRPDRRNGQFGRVHGGAGPDGRYNAGAAVNVFDGSRRITLLGLSNNVNQQNFASEDLAGVLGGSGGQRGGRGGRGGGARGAGPRGGGGDGVDPRSYLVGERGGLNTTHALGVNYTDRLGDRVRLNGSYFFNHTGNDTESSLDRTYFLSDDANRRYAESVAAEGENQSHRLNLRLEATLSDATELTVTPRLNLRRSTAASDVRALSALVGGAPLSRTANAATAEDLAYTSSTDVLLRHRFGTRGRTLSANLGVSLDGSREEIAQDVETIRFEDEAVDAYRRRIDGDDGGRRLSGRITYTEPLGERAMLQASYAPSVSTSEADQEAFRWDEASGTYAVVDSAFTMFSERRSVTQRAGLDVRYRGERVRASAGVELQDERLGVEQAGPRPFTVDRSYLSVLPTARLNVSLSERRSLDLSYRASTSTPGVRQLRDVVDATNPLLVTAGNPDLRPSTSHRASLRFRSTDPSAGSVLMAMASVTATQDYVGSATYVAGADSAVIRGIALEPGAQLAIPVNLDGYWNARAFVTAGRPVGFLRSNANASLGATYSRTPSVLAGVPNRADAVSLDGRLTLGSNVSERLDFALSYALAYTTVSNSAARRADDDYLRHRGSLRVTALPWRGLVLESDLAVSHFAGLSDAVDPTTARWNVGIGYKFLRDDLAEVRLTVSDVLNQNQSVDRTVTGTYIEDREVNALGRTVLLTLSYKLRHFGG